MPGVVMASSAIEAVSGGGAIVLVTEWPEFAESGLGGGCIRDRGRTDRRWALLPERAVVQAAVFTYEGIGR